MNLRELLFVMAVVGIISLLFFLAVVELVR
jgi:hypothetical protein